MQRLMLLTKYHIFVGHLEFYAIEKKCSTLTNWHTSDLDWAHISWQKTTKKHYTPVCRKTRLRDLWPMPQRAAPLAGALVLCTALNLLNS